MVARGRLLALVLQLVALAACSNTRVTLPPTPSPHVVEPSPSVSVSTSSSSSSSAPAVSRPGPTFVYRTSWIGVVGMANVTPGGGSRLYLTRDFSHWTDVTPPFVRADSEGDDNFEDAWFVDSRHGWVTAFKVATVSVDLYRTADGGRTWLRIPHITTHTASAGGVSDVQFLNTSTGYLDTIQPTAPGAELEVTSDGGLHWTQVSTSRLPDGQGLPIGRVRFLDAAHAVSTEFILCARAGSAIYPEYSADGGRTWAAATLPTQFQAAGDSTICTDAASFGTASTGVLPAAAVSSSESHESFLRSSDAGRTWTIGTTVPTTFASDTGGVAESGTNPTGAAAFDGSWWATGALPGGGRATLLSVDSGHTWHTAAGRGLPSQVFALFPIDARRAWAIGVPDQGAQELFSTADGGETWTVLNPAA